MQIKQLSVKETEVLLEQGFLSWKFWVRPKCSGEGGGLLPQLRWLFRVESVSLAVEVEVQVWFAQARCQPPNPRWLPLCHRIKTRLSVHAVPIMAAGVEFARERGS